MDCNDSRSLLDAYLDKELDRAEARELEAHLDGCAACRAELTRLDALRVALRDRALRYPAPAALRERIALTAARDTDHAHAVPEDYAAAPRAVRGRAPGWLALAAACVLAFGAGGMIVHNWSPRSGGDASALLAHDLFASHWRALVAASPVDVVSSDRHTVKPWFAGKVAQAPVVADFAEQGFPLVGGRIDYIGAQRVPVLAYRHGQHLIDVYVLPPDAATLPSEAREQGYSIERATLGGQPAAVVSDLDGIELAKFERLLSTRG